MDAEARPTTEDTTPDARRAGEKARIMRMLEYHRDHRRAGEPPRIISAIELASCLDDRRRLSRERLKRTVRELIQELRQEGRPILPAKTGYFLGQTAGDVREAKDYIRRNGVARLGLATQIEHQPATADARGQYGLEF